MQMGWEFCVGDVVGMVYGYVEVRAYAGGAEKWRIRRGGSVFFLPPPPPPRQSKYFLHLISGLETEQSQQSDQPWHC